MGAARRAHDMDRSAENDSPPSDGPRRPRALFWLRLGRALLLGPLIVIGWIALGAALLALGLEHSGRLNRIVETELARQLGPVANDLTIGSTEIDWTQRRVRLTEIVSGGPEQEVRLEHVELVFGWDSTRGPVLDRAVVDGGRLCLTRALMNGVQGWMSARPPGDGGPLPTLAVYELEVVVETPGWGDIECGSVDACLSPTGGDFPRLAGRVVPPRGIEDAEGMVFLSGELSDQNVLTVRASAHALPLHTDYLPPESPLGVLRDLDPRAVFEVEASGSYVLGHSLFPNIEAQLSLADGSLAIPQFDEPGKSRLEQVALDLSLKFTPDSTQSLWDRRAWSATGHLAGTWDARPLDAWVRFGREAPPGQLADIWTSARGLTAGEELVDALELPIASEIYAQYRPAGDADFFFAMRVPEHWEPADGLGRHAQRAFIVDTHGDASVAYHGLVSKRSGERDIGFPLRVENVDGRLIYAFDPELGLPESMGFVDVHGTADEGTVRVDGTLHSRPRWFLAPGAPDWMREWEFFLGARAENVAIDEKLERALIGLRGVVPPDVAWNAYTPSGGSIDFDLELRHDVRAPGLACRIGADIKGTDARYRGFGVPLDNVHGRLEVLADGKPALSGSGGWAVLVDATADSVASRDPVELTARLRGEALESDTPRRGLVSHISVSSRHVDVENEVLRDVLANEQPKLLSALVDTGAAGFVDVDFTYSKPVPDGPDATYGELRPASVGLAVVPQRFPMLTRGLEGRAIFHSLSADRPELERTSETRMTPLIGSWSNEGVDVPIAVVGEFSSDRGQIELISSGIDTTNDALLDSIGTAVNSSGKSFELESVGLKGEIDVSATLQLEAESGRVIEDLEGHLRSGLLGSSDSALLRDLRGKLRYDGENLSSEMLHATLGSTPLELSDFRLTQIGDTTSIRGRVTVTDLPLDYEHLRNLLDPESLESLLEDLELRGKVDIDGGLLEIEMQPDGTRSVHFRGALRLSNAFVKLGLPVSIQSAMVADMDLSLEGDSLRALARVRDLYGQVAGRQVERASLLMTLVQPRLSIQDLDGQFEGGRLRSLGLDRGVGASFFSVDLVPPFPFRLSLEMADVDVGQLLAGMFKSDFANEGRLEGDLTLEGDIETLTGIRGSGKATLSDSALWSVPVFQALFFQLGLESTAIFNEMASHFVIEDGTIRMRGMRVKSDLLSLVGEGSLDLEGRLDYDLEVRYSLVDRLGPLTRLLYKIQNSLLRVSIGGDMSRPKVILRGIISQFLRNVGEGPPELPLPGYSRLPRRF